MNAVFALFLLFIALTLGGECPGVCQPNNLSCPGGYQSGLCPGASNIQCCIESTPNCNGQCQINTLACNGTYTTGDCPGASNIQCCQNSNYTCNCEQNMCTNVPANNKYYLTSFCDPSVACGDPMACTDFFCADYKRFGCGTVITCCCQKTGTCSNLKVIDGGPACYVDEDAGGPVIDASYSMCQTCTGSTSCGWSDHIQITCTAQSSSFVPSRHIDSYLGVCSYAKGSENKCVGELSPSMVEHLIAHSVAF